MLSQDSVDSVLFFLIFPDRHGRLSVILVLPGRAKAMGSRGHTCSPGKANIAEQCKQVLFTGCTLFHDHGGPLLVTGTAARLVPPAPLLRVANEMKLFAVLAGRNAEKRVRRAPAYEPRGERDDPKICPGRLGSYEREGKDGDSRDDPNCSFDSTNVLLHDNVLLI